MNLSKDNKISSAVTITAGAAASTAVNGSILDMEGFEGVLVKVQTGAIVSGAVTSIKMQQDSASAMGSAQDLLGTSVTIADTDDDKTFYIDLHKPTKRYVRVAISRATQNATVAATYEQYGAHKRPVTHGANVSGETHIAPAEGTA